MWKFIRTAGIFTGIFGISFGAAFFSQYKKANKSDLSLDEEEQLNIDTVLTDKQKSLIHY